MSSRKANDFYIDIFHEHNIYVPTRTIVYGAEAEDGGVDYKSAMQTIRNLHILSAQSTTEPITLLLNTPGGDAYQGLAVYDAIRALSNPVTIHVMGECCSMGIYLLQAGDSRVLSPNSTLMIHTGSLVYEGEAGTVRKWIEWEKHVDSKVDTILLEKLRERDTTWTVSKLHKWQERDRILNARQAIELGLADRIA